MLKYHPYKSDKPEKNIILLQIQVGKIILGLLACLIFHTIKMRPAKFCILIGTRRMKTGVNQVLTPQASGLSGCYGINQPLKKVMRTLSGVFFKITC